MSAAVDLTAKTPRHFLELRDVPPAQLRAMLTEAARFKRTRGTPSKLLAGKTLAMIFEKPSTRTRLSFEVAIRELGGDAITLSPRDMQIGRGETIADTAKILSGYVHAIMLRTDSAAKLTELAAHATVPVINGLTDLSHPCQLMADILTFEEHRGPIAGKTVAWFGDGNNVAASWIEAAALFNFSLRLACPPPFQPKPAILAWAAARGADVQLIPNPEEAAAGAHALVTDTWISMSDSESETGARMAALAPYQVTPSLMAKAASDAVFMHCLPAHRGEEVAAEVIDGPASLVFPEAANRLPAQKAILAWCLG